MKAQVRRNKRKTKISKQFLGTLIMIGIMPIFYNMDENTSLFSAIGIFIAIMAGFVAMEDL